MKVVSPAVLKRNGSIGYEWDLVIDSKKATNFTGSSRQLLFIPGEDFVKYDRVVLDGYFSSSCHLNLSLGGLRDEGNRKHDWQLAITVSRKRMVDDIAYNRYCRERVTNQAMGVLDGYDTHIQLPAGL